MIEQVQGSTPEKRNEEDIWKEARRATLQSLRDPINLLAMDISRFEEKKEELKAAGQLEDEYSQQGQHALQRVLDSIISAQHLTIGGHSCICGTCEPMYLSSPHNHPTKLIWYKSRYAKGVYAVAKLEREPEEGEEVLVLEPFIGDNLLHEQVQSITVRPLDHLASPEHIEREFPFTRVLCQPSSFYQYLHFQPH